MHRELSSFPWHATALCCSSLCGAPAGEVCAGSWVPGSLAGNAPRLQDGTGIFSLPKTLGAVLFQKLSSQELSPKPSQEPAHESPCRLSWLLEQHEAVGTHVSHHESQLQQHGEHRHPHHAGPLCWVVPPLPGPVDGEAIPSGSPSCCSPLVPLPRSQPCWHGWQGRGHCPLWHPWVPWC